MIRPPAACTSSTTRAHPAKASSPWKRGTSVVGAAAGCPTTVPSVTMRPTPPRARRA